MIAILDTNHLDQAQEELKCPTEQLLTPLTRFNRVRPNDHFAIDNGAFTHFSAENFLSLLKRESNAIHLCRWVAVPDVVGSAIRTLEVFHHWKHIIPNWPLALVLQDGQESLPIPWDNIQAVFIGGSTQWKLSNHAIACIKAAQALNKWVHVGRINTPGRFEFFQNLNINSFDGSGLARFSDMRTKIANLQNNPKLPL